jgi:hypothetical protein
MISFEATTGRTTHIARLSINGTTDVTRNSTWLDDVVPQLFNLTNLPRQFMPRRENETEAEQQIVRYLMVDSSADYWQAEQEAAEQNGDNGGPEAMEASNILAPNPQAVASDGTAVANPAAVVTVEQNLARLAIVAHSA